MRRRRWCIHRIRSACLTFIVIVIWIVMIMHSVYITEYSVQSMG